MTNLTSFPRSNIVGLVGIECGYGNDLGFDPPLAIPDEDGPLVPPTADLLSITCPLGPDRAVVEICPLL